MYVKTKCSKCGQHDFHNLHLWVIEEIKGGKSTFKLDDAVVRNSVSEEELAQSVIQEL
ncbi:hypothetical protein HNV12_14750 [Methanococcoides sp. SA1]|nr:hypothetical protein [Methanococcoides sp. SA1]